MQSKTERVTITLPSTLVRIIDGLSRNRSRFILESVNAQLRRLQREELNKSLINPHPQSQEFENLGVDEWFAQAPSNPDEIVDSQSGVAIRWAPGRGWTGA